eukprot:jgi/Antlo1/168/776
MHPMNVMCVRPDLDKYLVLIHKITEDLHIPLKSRLIALILYANTFNKVKCSHLLRLSLVCINLACKIEETYYRLEKIIEHFCMSFNNFEVRKDELAMLEVEVAKKIDFVFEVTPVHFVYFKLLKTLRIARPCAYKMKVIEAVHLDSRILKLRYFQNGEFSPGDVALSLIDEVDLRCLVASHGMFIDFYKLSRIRSSLFHI